MELNVAVRMERRGLLDSSRSDEELDINDDVDEGEEYEVAITATGYGSFQYWLILLGGFANASDAIEILCVSILLPAAECDLHMTSEDKGWLSAIAFVGMMVGGYVWGCLGDIYGRRNVLMVSLVLNALSGLGSSFVQTFPSFLVLRLISGLGVGGSIPLVWAYISEFQPPSKRGRALSIIASFWMVGNVLVAVFALVTIPYDIGFRAPGFVYNSWRVFLTVCALPALITAIAMLWLPESPMFLLIKDRKDEALDILRNMYALNTGKPLYTFPIKSLSTAGLKVQKETSLTKWGTFTSTILQTWRLTKALFSRSLIFTSTIMIIINFTIQFGYYGLWMWFPELFNRLEQYYNDHPYHNVSVCDLTKYHGNTTQQNTCEEDDGHPVDTSALISILITSIAPLPANLWTVLCMDKLGRKFFLVLSMLLSGVAAFGVYLVKSSLDNLILACVFGAVCTMGFNALDCLGAELFPTHLRSTALAVTLISARLGAILGTVTFGYFVDLYCAIPLLLVAAFLIFGGFLGLVLPNTTRTALM
ncbi:synaptic vesicle glycoprotein 2B-like isoform X2 [Portunus trituberculatus]|uniref:synaptic vesicle glycoprotein 2B-like isoform X2 n=1 Tax=Portunus trituberculatus TaxID=210409 RepID=UPI001E1CE3AF|nr:synaptic vesicle glycoprotein 2B-like isoform X2 [Portunus trituberculatus]